MRMPKYDHGPTGFLSARLYGELPSNARVQTRVLRGGLEAAGVVHVCVRYQGTGGQWRTISLVAKRLKGSAVREAAVYERFVSTHASRFSPRLFSTEYLATGEVILYLEAVRAAERWPWRQTEEAQRVLEVLAQLHGTTIGGTSLAALADRNYETELHGSAVRTLELLQQCHRSLDSLRLRRVLLATRRLVLALTAIRRHLLACPSFGKVPIHGDVHSGNTLVRRRHGHSQPVLLDWGRARIGSPWEDVSSWLQSLGYWEPEVRRRHDTLLAGYLAARGADPRVTSTIRATYWLAGASNALAGALGYHLSIALDPRLTSARRARALHSARDWLRVIRRADAYWS
jgi:hypothetical protein